MNQPADPSDAHDTGRKPAPGVDSTSVNFIEFAELPAPSGANGGRRRASPKNARAAPDSQAPPEDRSGPDGKPGSRREETRSAAPSGLRAQDVPDSVYERFIKVGNNFFFPDGAEAFTHQGNRLTTRSQNTVVIQSMVAIAQHAGTRAISVGGTDFFRKEAWFAAKLAGLEVSGYEPTTLEEERLVRALARRQAAAKEGERSVDSNNVKLSERRENERGRSTDGDSSAARPLKEGELIVGRLVDHGPAPYQHRPNQSPSYYVRIETKQGERDIWGVDLERAFRQSLSTPGLGDEVGLRAVGRDPVTVPANARGTQGRESREDLHTHRNQWILERKDFLERREQMAQLLRDASVSAAEATKRFSELDGSYLQLQMGQELAEQQYPNKTHREQFVEHLREYLAKTVEYGKPLEPVPMRDHVHRTLEPEKAQDRDYAPTR